MLTSGPSTELQLNPLQALERNVHFARRYGTGPSGLAGDGTNRDYSLLEEAQTRYRNLPWQNELLASRIQDEVNLKFSVAHQIKIRTARRLGLSHMDLV